MAHPDEVLDLWHGGKSASTISKLLGVSRNSVIGVVFRARQKSDPRAVQRLPPWDETGRKRNIRIKVPPIPVLSYSQRIDAVCVPKWVPPHLDLSYRVHALAHGEESAASFIRAKKWMR